MITIKEFAEYFGVSYFTVWEWIKKGIIPDYERKGNKYLIDKISFIEKIKAEDKINGMNRFVLKKLKEKIEKLNE